MKSQLWGAASLFIRAIVGGLGFLWLLFLSEVFPLPHDVKLFTSLAAFIAIYFYLQQVRSSELQDRLLNVIESMERR